MADADGADKLRFLFDLFDFNEVQTISLLELEFMIQNCLMATSKIYGLGLDIPDAEIQKLVLMDFQEGSRVSLAELLQWCKNTEVVQQYFIKLHMDNDSIVPLRDEKGGKEMAKKFDVQTDQIVESKAKPGEDFEADGKYNQRPFVAKSAAELVLNKRAENFRAWL